MHTHSRTRAHRCSLAAILQHKALFPMSCTFTKLYMDIQTTHVAPAGSTLNVSEYIVSMTTATLGDVDVVDLQYTIIFRMPQPDMPMSNIWCGWLDLLPVNNTARFREDGCTL